MKTAKTLILTATIVSLVPAQAAFAGDRTHTTVVDCATASLADAVGKVDRSIANVIEFQGNCNEDVVVDGHRDLTLIGLNGASITATDLTQTGSTALTILRSAITVQSVTFSGGEFGVKCSDSSDCRFKDISIHGVGGGLALQTQSRANLIGAGTIDGYADHGIGIYGGSSLNVSPTENLADLDVDPTLHAVTIEGGGSGSVGVMVQDGSFFRSDNATITGNNTGVFVHRGAVAKLYDYSTFGIEDNTNTGVRIEYNSTAHIFAPIKGNTTTGLSIGILSSAQVAGGGYGLGLISGNGTNTSCDGPTSISNACP